MSDVETLDPLGLIAGGDIRAEKEQKANEKFTAVYKDALSEEGLDELPVTERMPQPTGYRILIMPYYGKEKSKGGILFADDTKSRANLATTVGYAVALGPDCYKDEKKFPSGPWCKQGDWVCFARYAGMKLMIGDDDTSAKREIRLLNDDEIIATIKHPDDLIPAF